MRSPLHKQIRRIVIRFPQTGPARTPNSENATFMQPGASLGSLAFSTFSSKAKQTVFSQRRRRTQTRSSMGQSVRRAPARPTELPTGQRFAFPPAMSESGQRRGDQKKTENDSDSIASPLGTRHTTPAAYGVERFFPAKSKSPTSAAGHRRQLRSMVVGPT